MNLHLLEVLGNCTWNLFARSRLDPDLLAILRKSLDRAIFLYIFIREVDRMALEL